MLLTQLLEDTTSGAVATYNKPLATKPIKRTGFMSYSADNNKCSGCNIIKKYGWINSSSSAKELKCTFCGATHKKHEKED